MFLRQHCTVESSASSPIIPQQCPLLEAFNDNLIADLTSQSFRIYSETKTQSDHDTRLAAFPLQHLCSKHITETRDSKFIMLS